MLKLEAETVVQPLHIEHEVAQIQRHQVLVNDIVDGMPHKAHMGCQQR
jgi:hypothetical protein